MSQVSANVELKRGAFELSLSLAFPSRGVTALLGPSGSGKSTVLRVLAGLERPQTGRIVSDETIWCDTDRRIFLPPQQRRVGMVFQDYALFSHLSVAGNVGYGLPRTGRQALVAQWLERLQLSSHADHYPSQLSGGQRQRVALARALAIDPDILLLDEPFSAIDVNLRQQVRFQLKQLVADSQRPVVIVSHHLEDALYLAEQVGVMVNGQLLQFGPTREVFANPCCRSVAQVVGWRNLLPVRCIAGSRVSGAWGEVELMEEPAVETAWLGVRPEHVSFTGNAAEGLQAHIETIYELGSTRAVHCRLRDESIIEVHRPWDEPLPAPGSSVTLYCPRSYLRPLSNCPLKQQKHSADQDRLATLQHDAVHNG